MFKDFIPECDIVKNQRRFTVTAAGGIRDSFLKDNLKIHRESERDRHSPDSFSTTLGFNN